MHRWCQSLVQSVLSCGLHDALFLRAEHAPGVATLLPPHPGLKLWWVPRLMFCTVGCLILSDACCPGPIMPSRVPLRARCCEGRLVVLRMKVPIKQDGRQPCSNTSPQAASAPL